jgi:DNA-binding transcriptional ArsR family regulator
MDDNPDIARIAALVGGPARARMLTALMEGRALTATELALEGEVMPSTASSHLEKLTQAGLLTVARQGRHRYFRIAGREVAAALEGLMAISPASGGRRAHFGPRDEGLRRARVCYDHLAGVAAVRLLDRLRDRHWVNVHDDAIVMTANGDMWFERLGVDVEGLRTTRRPLLRSCLDWSERQFHLGGSLGAALLDRLVVFGFARREAGSRAVAFSPRGEVFLENLEPPARVRTRLAG